ncbi:MULTISPECIES: flagellar hook assembly protein FlgD [unclassified Frondihabitans]|jgi:flagellar basal-body rod modification protein FlgD|uniref:flagellar hook assembly protein FlgD n=1 Tax=unclassified Frondihabitans TaxID=2626248 RepID=UPI0006FB0F7F|nr:MULTISPECIES: flagellar hook capping FlgD N-terminal domain-containing protein [unclassified Frondihabitans]KQQ25685.1 flagellar hook capping protein [Frondihabitans sp. Leaf304]RPE77507.1 flagellar basal-body rod modification protein FlgD [Frondihabitans sp. PhB153]RPF07784.1 flagellar basal-body rod modification protein FlgD [Frondihabitans sp. PhB161]
MALEGITGTVTTSVPASTTATSRAPKQSMDSEMFLQLLVSQLKNQDPSSPMDTNAMISQTTQLAMMEQVTNNTTTGNENFSLQMRISAANLVGKQVTYDDGTGTQVSGTASSVSFTGTVPTVSVGGKDIPLDSISGIVDKTSAAATTP